MTDPYAWIASLPKARQKAVRQHLKEIEHGAAECPERATDVADRRQEDGCS